jgi:hypothetical protein
MAEEIKNDALVEEALADLGLEALQIEAEEKAKKKKTTKRIHKRTVVHNAGVIELMLTEQIGSLKNAMDPLFLMFFDEETSKLDSFKNPKDKMLSIKGTYLIFRSALDDIIHCFKPYSDASLNKKHRAIKKICVEGLERFSDMGKGIGAAKNINNQYITLFAKEMCLFMTNFHCVLHKDTSNKERLRIVEEYCE